MKFHCRKHNSDGSIYRVWIEGWASDQFNLMLLRDFEALAFQLGLFGILMVEHDDE